MHLVAIPAFSDNYIWMIHNGRSALVVDPGDPQPVLDTLQREGLTLDGILVTHHHSDHTGGVEPLIQRTGARAWGPSHEARSPHVSPCREGEEVPLLGVDWQVMDVPGHTAGHIAFFAKNVVFAGKESEPVHESPILFCGDTLFSAGCGRLFEGTPAQMKDSLEKLGKLPSQTLICCAHEYTQSNIRFALKVDPDNAALREYAQICDARRARGEPTLPTVLDLELSLNPFLRSSAPAVIRAVQDHSGGSADPVSVFAALREWKNNDR